MIPEKKAMAKFVVLFGGIAALLVGILWLMQGGVSVVVSNETGVALTNVTVRFTGGSNRCDVIEAGSSWTSTVNPTGESSLSVSYDIGEGRRLHGRLDTYIERDYRGSAWIILGTKRVATLREAIATGLIGSSVPGSNAVTLKEGSEEP